ncbi:hypothetical protein HOLleu_02051 [Holothuria leucospilota]|uniref:CCHC-type domain-containing protein n=1 Tax=Holothuria leucospilota TaxID=206669 RepID=A0A9Q1CRM8_HOLLE|nr:hypothetical protein HOLleu_02051 [Holothuria leucospilota]
MADRGYFIGSVGRFESVKVMYQKRLEIWFKANKISDNDKVNVFLAMIGSEAFEVVLNHITPEDPTTRNQIALRLKFRSRKQQPNEIIADYILELKKLSRHCGYGDQLETNLRDTFVGGLANPKVQAKLLLVSHGRQPGTASSSAFKVSGVTKCYRCLNSAHQPQDCPHKTAKCFGCNKVGHFKRACDPNRVKNSRKTAAPTQAGKPRRGRGRSQGQRNANMVSPEDSDSRDTSEEVDFIGTLFHTTQLTKDVPPYTVVMRVEDTNINFTVDTAASVTVISETEFHKFFSDFTLKKARINLKSYSGDAIALAGETKVKVTYEDKIYKLPLVVVKGNKVALLGRNWLKHIKLQWENIFSVGHTENAVKQVLHKYDSVFKAAGPGDKIKHHMAEVKIESGSVPTFCKSRPVSYALSDAVGRELDRLEAAGITKKVKHSKWAEPIVTVPKTDDTTRICGDYKLTVNKVVEGDAYPLPTAEGIFATLPGGRVFSKIDLTNAYQQLELTERSKELLTVNTHKGLYQYQRLPFGVSTALAIFQSVMDQILGGIQGAVCYLDDILISTKTPEEHAI